MQVSNVLHVACWKYRMQKNDAKNCHLVTIAQLCWAESLQLRHVLIIGKTCYTNISSIRPHNMANFGPLASEIGSGVWGTPANSNGFHFLAALLHATLVVGDSQTFWRWTTCATYIWQGDHHVGHWPTFYRMGQKTGPPWFFFSVKN